MKRIFTSLLALAFVISLSAQNFIKFDATDSNGVKALNGVAFRSTLMDILVPENFDVTNVVVDYEVAATDALVGSMPTDFSTPKTVSVQGASATKDWTVTFKKVKKAALPLDIAFSTTGLKTTDWNENTLGWAGAGLDPAQSQIARYGNVTVTFLTAFSDPAEKISYYINAVGGTLANGIFDVLTSADGITWNQETRFDSSNPLNATLTEHSITPASNVRYAKWVYTNRDGKNVNINTISITKGIGTGINDESVDNEEVIYVSNNQLSVPAATKRVSIYNTVGSLIY